MGLEGNVPVWLIPLIGVLLFLGVLFTNAKLPLRGFTEGILGKDFTGTVEIVAWFGSVIWWAYYAYVNFFPK